MTKTEKVNKRNSVLETFQSGGGVINGGLLVLGLSYEMKRGLWGGLDHNIAY